MDFTFRCPVFGREYFEDVQLFGFRDNNENKKQAHEISDMHFQNPDICARQCSLAHISQILGFCSRNGRPELLIVCDILQLRALNHLEILLT